MNYGCPCPIIAESSFDFGLQICHFAPSSFCYVNSMFLNHQVHLKCCNHLLVFNNKNVMLITLYLIALNT